MQYHPQNMIPFQYIETSHTIEENTGFPKKEESTLEHSSEMTDSQSP